MKKLIKRILLGIVFLVLVVLLFSAGYMIKVKSELKKMSSVATGEITDNIFTIQDAFSNMYLVNDSGQYIAIDAGNKIDVISKELEKLQINPDDVVAVLLTHSDADHVASLPLFKKANVYLSKQEEQMLTGETGRFLFMGNKIDRKEYILLEDQHSLTIGNTSIKGILTPGHTPGAMCYLINGKYLFTGDALSLKNGKVHTFNEFFNMETEQAVKSLNKIKDLPGAEYIFTAHHGYTENYEKSFK